jgi:Ca2+-binding EF-hand superfamily protein
MLYPRCIGAGYSIRYALTPVLQEKLMMFRTRVFLALLSTMPMTALVSAQALPKAVPGTPAAVPATPPATEAKPTRFDEIDTNHDGFISRDEFLAAEKKRFDELDTNHDGKIDAKEIASSPALMERNMRMAERMVKQWDADGNGVVTAEEYKKSAEERFAKQDKDGTGKLARKTPPGMQRLMPPPTSPQPPKPTPPAPTKP